jgi:hypothetical protein
MSAVKLTPEQQTVVSGWVGAGDNLSAIQKKLRETYQLSLTYMDVRFLVDDLNLQLKDPAPKADTNLKGPATQTSEPPVPGDAGAGAEPAEGPSGTEDGDLPADLDDGVPAGGAGAVSVTVDKVTLLPGAVASGTVTFSDGVTGKWMVDNYGRPGFTEISREGYRPTPADAQAFMAELGAAMQQRGF